MSSSSNSLKEISRIRASYSENEPTKMGGFMSITIAHPTRPILKMHQATSKDRLLRKEINERRFSGVTC